MLDEDQVIISAAERSLLSSLIGQNFVSVSGGAANDHQLGDSIIVSAGSQILSCQFSFTSKALSENDVEDFPMLSISKLDDFESVSDSRPARFEGNNFGGSIIKDVMLVRCKLQLNIRDAPLAHLEYDRGIVIQFENGAVTFINLSDFDVIALLDSTNKFDLSVVTPPQTCREDTYWETWTSTDSFISLGAETLN